MKAISREQDSVQRCETQLHDTDNGNMKAEGQCLSAATAYCEKRQSSQMLLDNDTAPLWTDRACKGLHDASCPGYG